MSLKEYSRKRNYARTPEPRSGSRQKSVRGSRQFVIQKHNASHLHYDFRLDLGGTLKSWAVPKGFPYEKGEKRLAVQVEDHPRSYADFEGVIPKGEYGGGSVMVWDRGAFEVEGRSPLKDLESGKLHFELDGEKLHGSWRLVRLQDGGKNWLLIRGGDSMVPPNKKQEDRSVLSGRTMHQIASDEPRNVEKPLEFIEPMQARLVERPPKGNWLYEIKFDGWRAIALKSGDNVRLLSRNEKDFGSKFPEIVRAIQRLPVQDAIIDGEIVALDSEGRSSFQLLQAYDLGDEHPPLYFYAFDLLHLEGDDLRSRAVEDRKKLLKPIVKDAGDMIRDSAELGNDAESLLEKVREVGLEGLIGKRLGSKYEAGKRTGAWVKLKLVREQEFVIGGFTEPEGARSHFGALIVGYYENHELLYAAKVGTGFDSKLLAFLHKKMKAIETDACPFANIPVRSKGRWGQGITRAQMKLCHWIKPELVCQVRFGEWTRDGSLRAPVFVGLRDDKEPKSITRERGGKS